MPDRPLSPLPLFPLGTVLLPGGLLPLRIFEVRYLDMVGRCHREGRPFGVVGLVQGTEVRLPGAPTERFATVGTLARIRRFSAPQPGMMLIECEGAERFRIEASERLPHGLWTAQVELLPADVEMPVPEDLQPVAQVLRKVLAAVDEPPATDDAVPGSADGGIDEAPSAVPGPHRFDDCGWVANRWIELFPMAVPMKQRLMELESPLMRLELVGDLLAEGGYLRG